MAKVKTQFVCSDCGADYTRWQGQCRCGAWNTLSEIKISTAKTSVTNRKSGGYAGAAGGGSKKINEVEAQEAEKQATGIGELDRVLTGGVTRGSVNIISGDPGAGKTTLLSDLVARMSQSVASLYCTAEESLSQFKNRVHRLNLEYQQDNLFLLSETSVEAIIEELETHKNQVCGYRLYSSSGHRKRQWQSGFSVTSQECSTGAYSVL